MRCNPAALCMHCQWDAPEELGSIVGASRTVVQEHEQALQGRLRSALQGLLRRMLECPDCKLHARVLEPKSPMGLKDACKDGLQGGGSPL